jgi:pimeloyl-ACP methyl ester carboxylesterase
MNLDYDRGGEGPRLLVLLHGLGATREVWQPLLTDAKRHWQGSWIAPDLRGHGRSAHAQSYALGQHAADVSELVTESGQWNEIVLLGHSMGGAIALAMASGWFGLTPTHVFGLGIKVAWTPDDLAQLVKLASGPARLFETQQEAVERYLKVSGLKGLVAADSAVAMAGVHRSEQGFRLAADPVTALVGAPPMRALLAAAQGNVRLARGEKDGMVSLDQLAEFDAAAVDIAGAGHNAMVEAPERVWQWVEERLA